jgi:hypothetical protein
MIDESLALQLSLPLINRQPYAGAAGPAIANVYLAHINIPTLMREVGAVLLQLALQLFDEPTDKRSLFTKRGDYVWIGHQHMVGWPLSALNVLVVALAT